MLVEPVARRLDRQMVGARAASSAAMRCSVIGSGVVRLPSPGASEVCRPSVPMLAARLPNAAQS